MKSSLRFMASPFLIDDVSRERSLARNGLAANLEVL